MENKSLRPILSGVKLPFAYSLVPPEIPMPNTHYILFWHFASVFNRRKPISPQIFLFSEKTILIWAEYQVPLASKPEPGVKGPCHLPLCAKHP